MFLAKLGEYAPCGIFTAGHLVLFFVTALIIFVALMLTYKKSAAEIRKIIRIIVCVMWVLEIFRIGYKLYCGDLLFLESYMPLFFCSIFLYSGMFSAFGKGKLQRTGDVVLATGSLLGGVVFLLYPATSLPDYPILHFVSIHSFSYHGCMVYVGILMLITRYIELKKSDIYGYFVSVLVLCFVALLVNVCFDSNLMFISKAFPGKLGQAVFNATGVFYTPIMVIVHAFLPFYFVYGIYKLKK